MRPVGELLRSVLVPELMPDGAAIGRGDRNSLGLAWMAAQRGTCFTLAKHQITKDSDDKCPHKKASDCNHERKWMDEGKRGREEGRQQVGLRLCQKWQVGQVTKFGRATRLGYDTKLGKWHNRAPRECDGRSGVRRMTSGA